LSTEYQQNIRQKIKKTATVWLLAPAACQGKAVGTQQSH
jgi:hypothetical protein